MFRNLFNTCGASIAALALGLSLVATPVAAQNRHFGGGIYRGGGWHGGGGGWHGSGWRGGYGGWNGGYGGWGGGYGADYGYGAAGLGLGLLGGAIIASQAPYYGSGYGYGSGYAYPDNGGYVSSAACASRFKSYDPASGTYLGYDGFRHTCP